MIPHLSSEQLSEFILGRPNAVAAQHIRDCAACRSELAQFREALGEFGGAVRAWSADQANVALSQPASLPEPRSWRARYQLAWALLAAALFIIASFVLPRRVEENAAANDARLLNQVDAEVSRTVPASMEPLTRLVVEKQ